MSDDIYVSPRTIGFLATEKGCPRCCWWLDRIKDFPFVFGMPAIMFAADAMEKALFSSFIKIGDIPECFAPFTDIVSEIKVTSYVKFRSFHPKGVWLHGLPDVVGERSDDTIAVLDHKTAYFKGDGDPLMPQYRFQTLGYCWICEQLYKRAASGAALIYWEGDKTSVVEKPQKHWKDNRLNVPFSPKVHEFDVDLASLDPLIEEFIKIVQSSTPPEGKERCIDCAALEQLFAVNEELAMNDAALLQKFPFDREIRGLFHDRQHRRFKARYGGLALLKDGVLPAFDPEGMWAGWRYEMGQLVEGAK